MTGRILPVTAALLWRDEQLLLAQRLPGGANANQWELPGGKLEYGESPEACLGRELREELGLDARVKQVHGIFSHLAGQDLQILLLVYHCQPGLLPPRALECQDFCWVTPKAALDYDLAPLDRQIISELASGGAPACENSPVPLATP